MKARFLVLGLALCMRAAPALAMPDLFGFSFGNIRSTFDGIDSFSTMDWLQTSGDVYRNVAPAGIALFVNGQWGVGSEDFLVSMTISNVTAATADGSGSFSLKDVQGDTISGDLGGNWVKSGSGGVFMGGLTNVTYTSMVDNTFDGHVGSVSLLFAEPQPWTGVLMELNVGGTWFTEATGATLRSFDLKGGSVDATVDATPIPAPGTFLLGLFGLSAIGLRRRKFA